MAPPQTRTIARRLPAGKTHAGRREAKQGHRILHATDFSPASRRAFAMAVELARQGGADLMLVHALASPAMVLEEGYLAAVHYRDMVDEERQAAQTRLDGLAARARRAGVRASTHVLDGHPYEQIVRAARDARAGKPHGRPRGRALLSLLAGG